MGSRGERTVASIADHLMTAVSSAEPTIRHPSADFAIRVTVSVPHKRPSFMPSISAGVICIELRSEF